ncbi:MAG: S-DNA-T family DNA segregation ATPase FtsK/SpoIIIE [Alphaproteobacteria bacterium]|jgi:S-DNA-T family DNA segregation ATPase FtsK/SpoIIIE
MQENSGAVMWIYHIFDWLSDFIRDLIAFSFVIIAVLTCIACLGYSPDDPSFLQATDKASGNWLGLHGATYADIVLQTLGFSGYLISCFLLLWGTAMFRGRIQASIIMRLMYLSPVLLLAAATTHILFSSSLGNIYEQGAGGFLGKNVADAFYYLFSIVGLGNDLIVGSFCLLLTSIGLMFLSGRKFLVSAKGKQTQNKQDSNDDDDSDEDNNDALSSIGAFMKQKKSGYLIKPKSKNIHDDIDDDNDDDDDDTAMQMTKETYDSEDLESDEKQVKEVKEKSKSFIKSIFSTAQADKKPIPKQAVKSPRKNKKRAYNYERPDSALLQAPIKKKQDPSLSAEILRHNAQLLESVLEDFGVRGEIKEWHPGPVVTLYELEPAAGIRSSRVIGLADDIARAMSAISARVAVIPGKNAIGIELPNATREMVYFREIVEHSSFKEEKKELSIGLGKDIGGDSVVADLAKMPHLLIAGTTGSGKSVGINTMILSLLYKLNPKECKMIFIDPKMLELSVYDGIPHLLTPVVTAPKKAVCALKWVVREMEERYDMMSKTGVRKLSAFNNRIAEAKQTGEVLTRKRARGFDPETGMPIEEEEIIPLEPLPYIVVVVDEMADLMMVAGKEIEGLIQRIAQMARAAGIHLIMATQRPSVDVITGTIKANFPTRISFQVTSKIDSRTILGEQGAEQLLGQGDMLFMETGGRIRRVHGAFVSDNEVEDIVAALKAQGSPDYIDSITADPDEAEQLAFDGDEDVDSMLSEAIDVVRRDQKVSISYVQRKLKVGYNRAARIIEQMEDHGIITEADHTGKRELIS